MQIDPFLFNHLVEPLHFNIGGRIAPLSIRDQIIRGQLVIDRAIEQQILHEESSLLVVGAGVGGVTAAMRAAQAGIQVTLMEKETRPFSRHRRCNRWVDPTQYDWPVGHWLSGRLPWVSPHQPLPLMPLKWKRSDRANALTGNWQIQFNTFLASPAATNLTLRMPAQFLYIDRTSSPSNGVRVRWRDQSTNLQWGDFGAVVSAKGFGEERCYIDVNHPFRSFEFWEADPFEEPNLSWTSTESQPRVLISGGGDGALQDFLRIVTRCKSAREIWENLQLAHGQAADMISAIRDAEDQAVRSLVWGSGSQHDHAVLQRLHRVFKEAAEGLYRQPGVSAKIESFVRREAAMIHLVHECDHFGQGYALNRLLALLLIQHLENYTGQYKNIHFPNRRVTEIDCNGHPGPPYDAWSCHWQTHRVTMQDKPDCRQASTTGQHQEEYDVLILRHGIIWPAHLDPKDAAIQVPLSRQILPYHYPG